jgi:hypothetical protein
LHADRVATSVERSVALFGKKAESLNMLRRLAEECAQADWDGYGAAPVNPVAVKRADDFIRSLPDQHPVPEVSVEPDGCISLDWIPNRTQTFTVSIGETDRIPFAWVDGTNRGHAVARSFDGDVPRHVLNGLLMMDNDAAIRPA